MLANKDMVDKDKFEVNKNNKIFSDKNSDFTKDNDKYSGPEPIPKIIKMKAIVWVKSQDNFDFEE